jgi:hypothetical protein
MFIATTQAAIFRHPSVGSFNDPSDGQLDKPFIFLGASDDNDLAIILPFADKLGEASFGIGRVSIDGIHLGEILGVHLFQAGNPTDAVRDVAGGDDRGQHQAKAVYRQVSLPPVQFLAAVKSTVFLRTMRVCRLTVYAGRCPLRWLVLLAHQLVQAIVDSRQRAVLIPLVEIVEHRLPTRKIMRQHPPLTTAPRDVENSIDDPPETHSPRSPASSLWRDKRLEDFPLGVCRVRRVSLSAHTLVFIEKLEKWPSAGAETSIF